MSDLMVWVDIETEGLNVETCGILEVGIVITDLDLNITASESWLISKPYDVWANVRDPVVREMHAKSGLFQELEDGGGESWIAVQGKAIQFLEQAGVERGKEPMCGSTVEFDKKFLERHLPKLDEYFHYRTINVSSIKELAKKWGKPLRPSNPNKAHRPLQDLADSIGQLKFYREVWFK